MRFLHDSGINLTPLRAQRKTVSLNSHGEITSQSHDEMDFNKGLFTEVWVGIRESKTTETPGTSNTESH